MAIVISEFLANPVGADKDGEYIALKNEGAEFALLNGYAIADKGGKKYALDGYGIPAGKELRFFAVQTKISLNNSDEEVLLYRDGNIIDRLAMVGTAIEGAATRRGGEITPELKAELFDDLAGQVLPTRSVSHETFLVVGVAAGILAVAAVLIMRKLKAHGQFENNNSQSGSNG